MAMACCPKEYAEECEILICVDAPAPLNSGPYSRLRFGLLASSWLPRPLGIFLWRALHVMLLIISGVFWVLDLLTAFLFFSVILFGLCVIFLSSIFALFSLLMVAVDLVLLLDQSIRFCWSLVGFLACHEPIVEWRVAASLPVEFWKEFEAVMKDTFWTLVPIGVPCMSGSLYKETKDRKSETRAQWCQEVVHVHETIAL